MSAIREALERRGMGDSISALDTQSLQSPTASPLPPQTPSEIRTPKTVKSSEVNSEARMIIGALRERLKAISAQETSSML